MGPLRLFVREVYPTDRVCGLTDGVYAIVLTLLVLELKPPTEAQLTNPQLLADLAAQIPNFVAYIISFVVVAYFWMQHHRLFDSLEKCNRRAMVGNFVHLLLISLTPFSASLIGRYEANRPSAILFSILLGLASFTGTRLGRYIAAHEDWRVADGSGVWVALPSWGSYYGSMIAVVGILLSFVSSLASILLWALLPLNEVFVRRRLD